MFFLGIDARSDYEGERAPFDGWQGRVAGKSTLGSEVKKQRSNEVMTEERSGGIEGGRRGELGGVEFKSRDLGSDRGYRVRWIGLGCRVDLGGAESKPAPSET
jgi:hypothetical protein